MQRTPRKPFLKGPRSSGSGDWGPLLIFDIKSSAACGRVFHDLSGMSLYFLDNIKPFVCVLVRIEVLKREVRWGSLVCGFLDFFARLLVNLREDRLASSEMKLLPKECLSIWSRPISKCEWQNWDSPGQISYDISIPDTTKSKKKVFCLDSRLFSVLEFSPHINRWRRVKISEKEWQRHFHHDKRRYHWSSNWRYARDIAIKSMGDVPAAKELQKTENHPDDAFWRSLPPMFGYRSN